MNFTLFRDEGGEPISRALKQYGCDVVVHPLMGQFPHDLPDDGIAVVWPSARLRVQAALTGSANDHHLKLIADDLVDRVRTLATKCKYVLVVNLALEPERPGMAALAYRPSGDRYARDFVNLALAKQFADEPKIALIDGSRWYRRSGNGDSRRRRFYYTKTDLTAEEMRFAARDIFSFGKTMTDGPKRVIALDLDNTLWGGVVGDAGLAALKLGGHDPIGEAYKDFQNELLQLHQRGFLLALVSKNAEATALEAMVNHPEMVLRPDLFAAWQINWDDKATNLRRISAELNLPLNHFIFIDDSEFERGLVRSLLPEVAVPEWPTDPLMFVEALWEQEGLLSNSMTDEDQKRNSMYAAERQRIATRAAGGYDTWLADIDLQLTVDVLREPDIMRTEQLFSKTNQFNTTTRRLSTDDLLMERESQSLLVCRLSDRFGDYGLVSAIVWRLDDDKGVVTVTDFVLSCRAFDRGIEDAVVGCWAMQARAIDVCYSKTEKNHKSMEWLQKFTSADLSSLSSGVVRLAGIAPAVHVNLAITEEAVRALGRLS